MSFILDALKKSEIERQRQSVPGLMDAGIVRQKPRLPVWALALIGLLGVNLLVLLFVLTRNAVKTVSAPVAAAHRETAEEPRAATPAAPAAFSPLDNAPVYAPEIAVTSPNDTLVDTPAPAPRVPAAAANPGRQPAARRRDPLLTPEDVARADDSEVIPSINELSLSGAQSLPELHLDVHVYGTRAADRFVYINMRKYHEGATLQEGPSVERIRRDGVILNYQGLRFLLPRQ